MSMGKSSKAPEVSVTSLQQEDVTTHQEGVPVPRGWGRRKTALRWVQPVKYRQEKQAPSTQRGKK